jgi:hypothetical protein
VPVNEALAAARADFDHATFEAENALYVERQTRLSIFNFYMAGGSSADQAIRSLNQLG